MLHMHVVIQFYKVFIGIIGVYPNDVQFNRNEEKDPIPNVNLTLTFFF